jgi:hypothetical protein
MNASSNWHFIQQRTYTHAVRGESTTELDAALSLTSDTVLVGRPVFPYRLWDSWKCGLMNGTTLEPGLHAVRASTDSPSSWRWRRGQSAFLRSPFVHRRAGSWWSGAVSPSHGAVRLRVHPAASGAPVQAVNPLDYARAPIGPGRCQASADWSGSGSCRSSESTAQQPFVAGAHALTHARSRMRSAMR